MVLLLKAGSLVECWDPVATARGSVLPEPLRECEATYSMSNSSTALFLICLLALPSVQACARAEREKADRPRTEPELKVAGLRTEYKQEPFGIDVTRPRLSWQLQPFRASERGVVQSAYQVRVASSLSELQLGKNLVWDSGEIRSGDSIQQVYGGPPLRSGQRYYWQVRIWNGEASGNGLERPSVLGDGLAIAV